jgi:hypothetical protein
VVHQSLNQSKKLRYATFAAGFIFVSGGIGSIWYADGLSPAPQPILTADYPNDLASLPILDPQAYKPLLPDVAKLENEKLPFSNAPLERALPLVLPANENLLIGRRNATDCLTSAIYYEAGNEVSQGKRAVAQVILNRVRHPAYPKSICAVVYQGSERKTGCQFTFTCDGSLARRPARDRWNQARIIAIGAISGAVEPSVGMATHYHAIYVMPYWAPSLDKVSQIGTHIFYRWKGAWGRRRAFSQAVQLDSEVVGATNAVEFLPIADDKPLVDPVPGKVASRIIADDVTPTNALKMPSSEIKTPALSEIQADQLQSKLAIDEKLSVKK